MTQDEAIRVLRGAVEKLIKAKGRFHTEQNYKALVEAFDATATITPSPAQAQASGEAAIESIAANHDAMIILTQDYPREDKIRVIDAHTRRQVSAALATRTAGSATPVAEGVDTELPEPDHSLDCGMQPFYRPDQMLTYGAQQREAGRRELAEDLAWHQESLKRHSDKLAAVWANLRKKIEQHTGKSCEGEPFDALDAILATQPAKGEKA
jgi:hypothetical protein